MTDPFLDVEAPCSPIASGWLLIDPMGETPLGIVEDPYNKGFQRVKSVIALHYEYRTPYEIDANDNNRKIMGKSEVWISSSVLHRPEDGISSCALRDLALNEILPQAWTWTNSFDNAETYRTNKGPFSGKVLGGKTTLIDMSLISKEHREEGDLTYEEEVGKSLEKLRGILRPFTDVLTAGLQSKGWTCTVEVHSLESLKELCKSLNGDEWRHYRRDKLPDSELVETHCPDGLAGAGDDRGEEGVKSSGDETESESEGEDDSTGEKNVAAEE